MNQLKSPIFQNNFVFIELILGNTCTWDMKQHPYANIDQTSGVV